MTVKKIMNLIALYLWFGISFGSLFVCTFIIFNIIYVGYIKFIEPNKIIIFVELIWCLIGFPLLFIEINRFVKFIRDME